LIVGGLYLGSQLIFNFFIKTILDFLLVKWEMSIGALSLKFVAFLLYYIWIFFVYVFSLLIVTFWTQDIFDEVGAQRLKDYIGKAQDKNKKEKVEGMMKRLKIKEMSYDMIQRTIIVTF